MYSLLTALALLALAPGGCRAALSAGEEAALLARHNALRAAQSDPCTATDMRQLVWDSSLAAVSQAYAETCVWAHNANRNAEAGYAVGENLWMSSSTAQTATILESAVRACTLSVFLVAVDSC